MDKAEVLKIIKDHANKEQDLCGLFIPKSSFEILSSKITEATSTSADSTAIDELIFAVRYDYENDSKSGFYEDEMRLQPLSKAVIDKLIKICSHT